jgi:hypothetical protein
MRNIEKAPAVGATGASKKDTKMSKTTIHFITVMMALATVIAGWNIVDVWSGVVTALCGLSTLGLFWSIYGIEEE